MRGDGTVVAEQARVTASPRVWIRESGSSMATTGEAGARKAATWLLRPAGTS